MDPTNLPLVYNVYRLESLQTWDAEKSSPMVPTRKKVWLDEALTKDVVHFWMPLRTTISVWCGLKLRIGRSHHWWGWAKMSLLLKYNRHQYKDPKKSNGTKLRWFNATMNVTLVGIKYDSQNAQGGGKWLWKQDIPNVGSTKRLCMWLAHTASFFLKSIAYQSILKWQKIQLLDDQHY